MFLLYVEAGSRLHDEHESPPTGFSRPLHGGSVCRSSQVLKHTTTLFALSDHYILSREWRVIVDQAQTNYYHGRLMVV